MNENYIKTGRSNQKRETREKILKSAQYFLNRGEDFNLEDVAKRCGVSRATIYRYYSNVEILAAEAGLDINTKSPEAVLEQIPPCDLEGILMGIQEYYNSLAMEHEAAFRKYLSAVVDTPDSKSKRGARRIKSLELALEKTDLTAKQKKNVANLLTLMMGIEPMIVAKDVAGLDNCEAKELMKWGMELLLTGLRETSSL